jgi:hypothetical protein
MMQTRKRHIWLMKTTCKILDNVLQEVTQEQATTLRDGPDGWSVVEVVCHLRDFDGFFHHRAIMMLEQDQPTLPGYDHEALAVEGNYNSEQLTEALAALKSSRQRFIDFFKSLTEEQWERTAIHPEREYFNMTEAVIQVGLHDVTHIEQITRILANG